MCERNAQRAERLAPPPPPTSVLFSEDRPRPSDRVSERASVVSLSLWLSRRRHSLHSLQTAEEGETIFLAIPELSIPGAAAGFQSTLQSEEHRTGRRSVTPPFRTRAAAGDFDSPFPPRASAPFPPFPFSSPPPSAPPLRCSVGRLSNGELTGGTPAGNGSGRSTGEEEAGGERGELHLQQRFDLAACISRRRRRR